MSPNLGEWLRRLEQIHPTEIDLGLDRVLTVAKKMELDLSGSKVITVGGTNGKGSTVALLRKMLRSHGFSVACYTSPHIQRFNERITIDNEPLSDEDICQALAFVDSHRGDTSLTYFEFTTLAALHCFEQFNPHYCLLEVGLGGRLDAVNIVEPDVTIVTNIALDHQAWLGDDLEGIAVEKAGIFRAGVPAICPQNNPPKSLQNQAEQKQALWLSAGAAFELESDSDGSWHWQGRTSGGESLRVNGPEKPPLALTNVAAALQACAWVLDNPQPDLLARSAVKTSVPGRCQRLEHPRGEIIVDVAHNAAAAQRLASYLADNPAAGTSHCLFAIMADKDAKAFIDALDGLVDGQWWLPDLDNPRAMPASELANLLGERASRESSNTAESAKHALEAMQEGDRLIVMGSFITVGEFMTYLEGEGTELE